jgi:hypothetical protein
VMLVNRRKLWLASWRISRRWKCISHTLGEFNLNIPTLTTTYEATTNVRINCPPPMILRLLYSSASRIRVSLTQLAIDKKCCCEAQLLVFSHRAEMNQEIAAILLLISLSANRKHLAPRSYQSRGIKRDSSATTSTWWPGT